MAPCYCPNRHFLYWENDKPFALHPRLSERFENASMSYLVFARKWRPLTFDDVIGQEHIVRTLKHAIEKDRIAHAYIFSGTRGVGKTTTARILARALNCDNGPTPNPCGTCETCRSIISGASFDVLEIDGASNNSVNDIRELRENVGYSAMGGKYKHRIYVIDEVHMLSTSAFNALLKTLEEPPKNVIFIFATTEPQKIPATIHSRCQRYDFRRISVEQIAGQLDRICTSEKIAFEKSAIQLIARKADGSMRDALSFLDQVYSFCRESITEKDARLVLGLVEMDVYKTIMSGVAERIPGTALRVVEDVLNRGFDLGEFITGFQEYLRVLLFLRIPGISGDDRIDMPEEILRQGNREFSRFSEGDLLRMIELLRQTEYDLRRSTFPRFLVEVALVKLVYMDSSVAISRVLSSLGPGDVASGLQVANMATDAGRNGSDTPPAVPAPESMPRSSVRKEMPGVDAPVLAPGREEPAGSFGPEQPRSDTVDPGKQWTEFLDVLMRDRPNLGTSLSLGRVASTTADSVDLRFGNECKFQFSEVTRKGNREVIAEKLSSFAGRHIDLHITMEQPARQKQQPADPGSETTAARHPSLQDDLGNEPIIQSVIDMFDAEVL